MQVEEKLSEYNLKKKDECKTEDNFPMSLLKPLHDIIKKEEYVTYTVEKRSISTVGGNYLSILFEVDVKGRTAREDKETNIFIKYMIGNKQEIFSVADAYLKEKFAYSELFKVFEDLQEEANVPLGERFKTTRSFESPSEAIMLENLSKKGFVTPYRMDPMSLKFAEMSIEQLAKFHGFSFVLQELKPEYFNRKVKSVKHPFRFGEDWNKFYTNQFDLMSDYVSEARMKKLRALLPKCIEKVPQYMANDNVPGCVLCHGDYRANNILMKEENGEVTEVMPVDYQLLYYGCPINDFMYFIITGSDGNLRRKHTNDLKNLYFDSLEKFVSYFGLNIENIYPRKEFERQYEERLEFGLMLSFYTLPFIYTSEDDVPDMATEDLTNLKFTLDERYKQKLEEILEDYETWGIL